MIRGFRDLSGNVQQEDPERQENDDSDLDLLSGSTEKYWQQQHWRHDTRQDDVQDVERVTSTEVDPEPDVRVALVRTTFVRELFPFNLKAEWLSLFYF